MIFRSLLPPVPDLPFPNAHHLFLNRPEQAEWKDYVLHVDAVTGKARKWSEFKDWVKRGATAFGDPGLFPHEENEIVGVLSENSLEYVALVHSLLAAGIPFALFPASPTPYELKHLVKVSRVRKVFTSPQNFENARVIAKEAGFSEPDGIFILGGEVEGKRSFGDLVRSVQEPADDYAKPVNRDALAYLILSSGTTGPPKGVMISHKNIMFSAMQGFIVAALNRAVAPPPRSTGIPVTLVSVPFYHSYGLNAFCFRAFELPCTLIIMPRWDVGHALRLIPKWKVTLFPLVPSIIHQLVNSPEWMRTDTSSIEVASSGAAFLSPELRAKFQSKLEATVFQGYGLSESTLAVIGGARENFIPGYKPADKSLGVLLSSMQARIVREDGTDSGVGEPGELWVKGDCISQGYINDEQATAKAFTKDGWLKTGDIFTIDEKGNYYFIERAKDTLKISGVQVSPTELEVALMAQPDGLIEDVVVAGVSGGRTLDEKVPRAWFVLSQAGKRKGPTATIKALEEWSRQNLTKQKWLRGGFEIVVEVPKSPTGKVLRRILQDEYERKKGRVVVNKSKL